MMWLKSETTHLTRPEYSNSLEKQQGSVAAQFGPGRAAGLAINLPEHNNQKDGTDNGDADNQKGQRATGIAQQIEVTPDAGVKWYFVEIVPVLSLLHD